MKITTITILACTLLTISCGKSIENVGTLTWSYSKEQCYLFIHNENKVFQAIPYRLENTSSDTVTLNVSAKLHNVLNTSPTGYGSQLYEVEYYRISEFSNESKFVEDTINLLPGYSISVNLITARIPDTISYIRETIFYKSSQKEKTMRIDFDLDQMKLCWDTLRVYSF